MKSLPLVLLLFLTSSLGYAQYLGFITRAGEAVDAPVSMPDGSPPGPGFRAQLFRVFEDGTLLPLVPTTTFQSDAQEPGLRYYVKPVNMIVPDITFPDIFADPIEITVRMRAWEGSDWTEARWRGESEDIQVLIKNLLFPPANLVGLKGFTLKQQPAIGATSFKTDGAVEFAINSSETNLASVVVERSNDLVNWQFLGEFSVAQGAVTFTDPEIVQSASGFYRLRFP